MPDPEFFMTLGHADLQLQAAGVIAEPYPRGLIATKDAAVDGTVYLSLVGLEAGDPISGVCAYFFDGGTGLTLLKTGIYSAAGDLVVSSDNASGRPLGAPALGLIDFDPDYSVAETGYYYLALLITGTTPNQIGYCDAQPGVYGAVVDSAPFLYGELTGQTDLPDPMPGTPAATTRSVWLAAY